jgi:hypothetical protein
MDRTETLAAGKTNDSIKTMEFLDGEQSRAEELWDQVYEELKAIDVDLALRVDDLRCAMVNWAWDLGFARATGESELGTILESQRSQLLAQFRNEARSLAAILDSFETEVTA